MLFAVSAAVSSRADLGLRAWFTGAHIKKKVLFILNSDVGPLSTEGNVSTGFAKNLKASMTKRVPVFKKIAVMALRSGGVAVF